MNSSLSCVLAGCLAIAISAPAVSAQNTADTLKSPRVKHRVRLQTVDVVEAGRPKTVVQVVVDDDGADFHDLPADRSFLASGPISITVSRFNPLTTAVAVKVDDVADPTHATLAKLVEGFAGAGKILGFELSAIPASTHALIQAPTPTGCEQLVSDANADVEVIRRVLNHEVWRADQLAKKYQEWAAGIDERFNGGASGPYALDAALEPIKAWHETQRGSLASLARPIERMNAAWESSGVTPCDQLLKALYSPLRDARAEARRDSLMEVLAAVKATHESLESYARISRWTEASGRRDFIARSSIEPTGEHLRKVSVTFTRISYAAPNPSSTMVTKKEEAATASFVVRRYAAWVPEIGVGLTYSSPKRPKYGTAKNDAGETIIGEAESDASSLDPSILVNFVCGFCRFTAVTPMFQIGASTSKTTPAFFVGGGLRLFATSKGDFALGAGLIFPWAKQLKDGVAPGTVIDGTAALENHLEWRRVEGKHVYVSIQYKF